MGGKTISQEIKIKVPRPRLFKALVTQSHEVIPKITTVINKVELDHGHLCAPGCTFKIQFCDGSHFSNLKNKVDEVDSENYVIKFTSYEGTTIGDKYDKICSVVKFEDSGDGETILKLSGEYHTKDNHEPTATEINDAIEGSEKFYKACEEYLIAHPTVCT